MPLPLTRRSKQQAASAAADAGAAGELSRPLLAHAHPASAAGNSSSRHAAASTVTAAETVTAAAGRLEPQPAGAAAAPPPANGGGAPAAAAPPPPPAARSNSSGRRGGGFFARLFGCCGQRPGRERRPKREHRRRRHHRRHRHAAGPAGPASRAPSGRQDASLTAVPGTPLTTLSIVSDSEYHDARDAWSMTDGAEQSPLSSAQVSPRAHDPEHYQDISDRYDDDDGSSSSGSSGSSSGSSAATQHSAGFGAKIVSCLSIIRASSAGEDDLHGIPRMHHQHAGSRQQRLPAGCTFARRAAGDDPDTASLCWDECEASLFQIRSPDYAASKVKQTSGKAIYRLVAMDLFATDSKAYHIAKAFALPHAGQPVVCKPLPPGGPEVALPPLLVMNVQLPDYPAAIWGSSDGPGQSIVYYFALREDFDPDKFDNQPALGLLQRFVGNGREADGTPTRDRLKMIVRVANLEEWARVAPLSATEYRLLQNYNEKPVLTRPQHAFHVGPNYLEVDLDVHNYAFLARKALWSYHDRLPTVVWDMGFVIQGNCPEELPEQILGCGRIFRSDFRRFRFLSDVAPAWSSSSAAPPSVSAAAGSRPASLSSPAAERPGAAGAGAAAGPAAAGAAGASAAAGSAAAAAAQAPKSGGSSSGAADAAVLVPNGVAAGGGGAEDGAATTTTSKQAAAAGAAAAGSTGGAGSSSSQPGTAAADAGKQRSPAAK